ncbi:MAG: hypothetical protein GC179_23755 [Anaerolineaceae bacterium]|nr:hypothetical protein [Anaerolineaceae bacterium]
MDYGGVGLNANPDFWTLLSTYDLVLYLNFAATRHEQNLPKTWEGFIPFWRYSRLHRNQILRPIMPRLLFKLMPLVISLLMILILVAHIFGSTQQTSLALRGFVEGCQVLPQPCWYGIVPGITTLEESKAQLLSHGYVLASNSTVQLSATKITDDCQKAVIVLDSHVKQISISLCERVALGDFVRQFNQPEYIMLDPLSIWYGGEIQLIFGRNARFSDALSYYTPLQEIILFPLKSSVPQLRQPWLDVLLQRKYCNLTGLRYHCSN